MKKNFFFSVIAGLVLLCCMVSSCSKELDQMDLKDPFQSSELFLKSGGNNNISLSAIEMLGKNLYFDKISTPNSMSCAECHAPSTGFSGPMAGINIHGSVYRGADAQNFGNRKPPSAAYATFSPIFYFDEDEGLFVGGNFWDGRATGERLGSPTAEQALGPFLNPAEHNVADKLAVLQKISKAKYINTWAHVWGEPLSFDTDQEIEANYDRIGLSIAAYEGSAEVNQFSSKFDYYLKGIVELTPEEELGFELFNSEDKGRCALCHISDGEAPLFTDFTYDNVGTPKNPENPVYDYDPSFVDQGLGGFLATRDDYMAMSDENLGKHKVPTLRNVDKKPGKGFKKAYMHNGVFKSLYEVVHFYNTRDVNSWPEPEVSENVNNSELGDLGLTLEEEEAIVAFLECLSDGYVVKK